ncbi:MAG: hypothetical protein Q8O38_11545 [Sulfurimicrobium sp.]|nr:hypothetical protein [Sulfurimicrobium sp.]
MIKRKIHYIDAAVQNRLLIALVLLEVLLISAGMIVLYLDMKEVVDENLFRIHFAATESLSALLFREAMQALAVLVIVNVAALGLAEWLWSRYLDSILRPLSGLLARTGDLDFSLDETFGQRHAVLELAVAWREAERERCKGVHAEISRLDENADYSSTNTLEQARAALENLMALLPVHNSGSRNRSD